MVNEVNVSACKSAKILLSITDYRETAEQSLSF